MSKDMLGGSALASVAGPLEDFAQKLGSPGGEQWLRAFKRFLRKEEIVWHEFLRPAGEITFPASTARFDPHQYFQTRSDLYVWDWFKDRILKYVQEVDGSPEVTLSAFDLAKPANDAEIRSELPEGHVFGDPSAFCTVLAKMIDRQSNGEKGDLLANGYWNIFYVRAGGGVLAVLVGWRADDRRWLVFANPLGDGRWYAGRRAFSATA